MIKRREMRQPFLDGHYITVRHVVAAVNDFEGVDAAADQLRISTREVEAALEYAADNPDQIERYREEFRRLYKEENNRGW